MIKNIENMQNFMECIPLYVLNSIDSKSESDKAPTNKVMSVRANNSNSINSLYLFNRENLDCIRNYSRLSLLLPVNTADFKGIFGYTVTDSKELSCENLLTAFSYIRKNGTSWSNIEHKLPMLCDDLINYSKKISENGNKIVDIINSMPVMKRLEKLSDIKTTLIFSSDDMNFIELICKLLNELKSEGYHYLSITQEVLKQLSVFRNDMDNNVVPRVYEVQQAFDNLAVLSLSRTFEYTEHYGFLGLCTRNVSNHICYSINKGSLLKRQYSDLINQLNVVDSVEKYKSLLDSINNIINRTICEIMKILDFIDIAQITTNTNFGMKNLETIWDAVARYFDDSIETVNEINESNSLLIFKTQIQSIVNSWDNINQNSKKLIDIFS